MNNTASLTQKHVKNYFPATFWVTVFVCTHLVLWTVAPILVRSNLPLDAIEGTIWGHQLEWGYDKNPFLNGWLTALAVQMSDASGWVIYLFSQLSVVFCFWAVWELGKTILSPLLALIAVMLLEGIQYFNFHAIDFNDNTLELGLWALTICFFYKALRAPNFFSWSLTGLFAGLSLMAKYYTAALLAAMALFFFLHAENRKQLKTFPPYSALILFLIIISPHVAWLFSHDFITVRYVFDRASSKPHWSNHLFYPAQFAWQQLQVLLPALILYAVFFIGRKPQHAVLQTKLDGFDRSFLFYIALGPFLLTLLLAFVFGITLRAGWGMPLLSFWTLLLISYFPPKLTHLRVYCFIGSIFVLMFASISGYYFSLTNSSDTSSANFPGHEIAKNITQNWHDTYHTKLSYVAGSRWVGGNIGFYSKDHPAVFVEWDSKRAPWININDMRKKGAVFIWSITDHENMPQSIQDRYPKLIQRKVIEYPWKRNKYNLPPIQIGLAILPPEEN